MLAAEEMIAMSILAAFVVPHPPLIVPGVGHGRETGISATIDAYREVGRRIAELAPETIVISSPHSTAYLDYFHISGGRGASGTFAQFGDARDGSTVMYDQEFVRALCDAADAADFPAGIAGERMPDLDWGVLVPLHFVQEAYALSRAEGEELPAYQVVRIGLSGLSALDHYRLGQMIQRTAEQLNRRAVYIASGDLSHKLTEDGPYGFAPDGPVFDEYACQAFKAGDFLALLAADAGMCERAAECGLCSFQIMAGSLDRTPVAAELLSYEGPFGVGYGIAAFTPTSPAGSDPSRAFDEQYEAWRSDDLARRRAEESPWVRLARFSLESFVRDGVRVNPMRDVPDDLSAALPPELFGTQAGAFVSLKKDGHLRGCIGTILPTRDSLAEEICANAISAGCRDPRFSPVEPDELDNLVYDVDVLSEPEGIAGPEALDPKRYGVIVSCGGRRGLLLPDLDGVDTVEEQVRIAAQKGGIDPTEPGVTYQRFTITRHV